jgi:hypothetical protein
MSKHSSSRRATSNGPYIDGLASVLMQALKRHERKRGDQGILLASRPLDGAEDGGPVEIMCGERPSYPPKTQLLELTLEERRVAEYIVAESLQDPTFEPWSDLVVVVRFAAGGVQVAGMPRPTSLLVDPSERRKRDKYLQQPPVKRMESLLAMANGY